MKEEVLEEMRSERERKMKASLKLKIEKRLIAEMSSEIRQSLESEIRDQLKQEISEELKKENSKELGFLKRKLQATSQTKKDKMVSQHENEFNVRVNQQVQAKLEVREKEIARKYKMQAAKEKA